MIDKIKCENKHGSDIHMINTGILLQNLIL